MSKLSQICNLGDLHNTCYTNHPFHFLTKSVGITLLLFACLVLDHVDVLAVTPTFDNAYLVESVGFEITSIAVGDLNGDGALDVVTGSRQGNSISIDYGNSDFTDTSFNYVGGVADVELSDMNGDGLLDIIAAGRQILIYLNSGDRRFSETVLFENPLSGEFETGDLNGDGFIDIVSTNLGQGYLHFNNGTGHITNTVPLGSAADSLTLGDINNDGSLDIVVGAVSGRIGVYLNNGQGQFASALLFGSAAQALTLGDINHDGFIDIVTGEPNRIYFNNGLGSFKRVIQYGANIPTDSASVTAVELGDMNNDGALDIAIMFESTIGYVFLNDASNRFTTSVKFGATGETLSLALAIADMNADGSLDIVVCSYAGGRVYLNDGKGVAFSSIPFASDDSSIEYAPLGDMDNDGDLDIVVGGEKGKILLNNGIGQLTRTITFTTLTNGSYRVLGDMNHDGFLDIVTSEVVYLNDKGNGAFLPYQVA